MPDTARALTTIRSITGLLTATEHHRTRTARPRGGRIGAVRRQPEPIDLPRRVLDLKRATEVSDLLVEAASARACAPRCASREARRSTCSPDAAFLTIAREVFDVLGERFTTSAHALTTALAALPRRIDLDTLGRDEAGLAADGKAQTAASTLDAIATERGGSRTSATSPVSRPASSPPRYVTFADRGGTTGSCTPGA